MCLINYSHSSFLSLTFFFVKHTYRFIRILFKFVLLSRFNYLNFYLIWFWFHRWHLCDKRNLKIMRILEIGIESKILWVWPFDVSVGTNIMLLIFELKLFVLLIEFLRWYFRLFSKILTKWPRKGFCGFWRNQESFVAPYAIESLFSDKG